MCSFSGENCDGYNSGEEGWREDSKGSFRSFFLCRDVTLFWISWVELEGDLLSAAAGYGAASEEGESLQCMSWGLLALLVWGIGIWSRQNLLLAVRPVRPGARAGISFFFRPGTRA